MQIGVEEISKSYNPKLKLDVFLLYFGQEKETQSKTEGNNKDKIRNQ